MSTEKLDVKVESLDEMKKMKMPNKEQFSNFFKEVVKSGLMNQQQFMNYQEIKSLLFENLIFEDDIDELWVSAIGDSPGLDEEEAYEMLCMVTDLPDPEDVEYLEKEFNTLTNGKSNLSFSKFLLWQDIQDMLADEVLTMESITSLWREVAGDLNTPISLRLLRKLDRLIDEALDDEDDKESNAVSNSSVDTTAAKEVVPVDFFDEETLLEINEYFENNKDKNNLITFSKLQKWDDIINLIQDGILTNENVVEVWNEVAEGQDAISYDGFLQFNMKLDILMDERENSSNSSTKSNPPSDNNVEEFYMAEFENLMGTNRLMPFSTLKEWKEMKELLRAGVLTDKQLETLYNALPVEPMGLPATDVGITIESFVKLNQIIDAYIDNKDKAKNQSSTTFDPPISLSTELVDTNDSATESELELMKLLDSAENLLSSGSFEDFDKLIGDENDPRLSNVLKSPIKISSLQKDLNELISLAKVQKRCGLDPPTEYDNALLSDLYQVVTQNVPQLANSDIEDIKSKLSGKWKLIFTNSEMFRFYNGLTGFPNVFPATKFESVSLEYITDGFLNELKYFEKLANPFGGLEAVVYGNWDLIKETSFMTNQISVILRSYCTKVRFACRFSKNRFIS
jgi:hypothetical protein